MKISAEPMAEGAAAPMSMSAFLKGAAGTELRMARERQGLSLEDVHKQTRIPVQYLDAIERCHFEDFIAPIYAMGFARSYARLLDVPDLTIVEEVRHELAENAPQKSSQLVAAPKKSLFAQPYVLAASTGIGAVILYLLAFRVY